MILECNIKNPRIFFRFSVCGSIFWTFCEISTQFGEVHIFLVIDNQWGFSANRHENCKTLTMLFGNLWKIAKIRDENLLNCWCRRGAKECKSDRSPPGFSDEYLLAKFWQCYLKICEKSPEFVTKICWIVDVGEVQRNTSIHFHYFIFNLGSFLPKDACTTFRSRQEFSNECLVARIGFSTAENESLKVCQKVITCNY